jgi:hypothetical protein
MVSKLVWKLPNDRINRLFSRDLSCIYYDMITTSGIILTFNDGSPVGQSMVWKVCGSGLNSAAVFCRVRADHFNLDYLHACLGGDIPPGIASDN